MIHTDLSREICVLIVNNKNPTSFSQLIFFLPLLKVPILRALVPLNPRLGEGGRQGHLLEGKRRKIIVSSYCHGNFFTSSFYIYVVSVRFLNNPERCIFQFSFEGQMNFPSRGASLFTLKPCSLLFTSLPLQYHTATITINNNNNAKDSPRQERTCSKSVFVCLKTSFRQPEARGIGCSGWQNPSISPQVPLFVQNKIGIVLDRVFSPQGVCQLVRKLRLIDSTYYAMLPPK